jgi:hypothetical protein
MIVGYLLMAKENRITQNGATLLPGIVGSQTIAALQMINVLGNLATPWPSPFKDLLASMRILNFDVSLFNLNCLGQPSAPLLYAMRVLMICLFFVVLLLIHSLLVVVLYKGQFSQRWTTFVSITGVLFMIFYISVANAVFTPFRCYEHPNGKSTLRDFLTVTCWEDDDHTTMIITGAIGTLLPLGFLTGCMVVIWNFPRQMRLKNVRYLYMFRFLFFKYSPETYWYSSVLLIRNLLMSCAPILPNATAQIFMIFFTIMPCLIIVLLFLPWNNKIANALEASITFGIATMLMVATLFVEAEGDETTFSVFCCVVFGVMVLGVLVVLGNAFYQRFVAHAQKPFACFLCHHKAGAGCFARLLKLFLSDCPAIKKKVWIDCDDLQDLTLLFGYVGSYSDQVIALCSKRLLCRPWCVGELTTARHNKIPVNCIVFPDFEFPDASFIRDYAVHVPDVSNLAPHGIDLEEAQTTLSWFASNGSIKLPDLDSNGLNFMCQVVTTKKWDSNDYKPKKSSDASSGHSAWILCDHSNHEATATALIIEKLVLRFLLNELSKAPPVLPPDAEVHPDTQRIIYVCSAGCFTNPACMSQIFQAAELTVTILPIISEDSFRFPTPVFFDELAKEATPILQGLGTAYKGGQLVGIIKQMFKEIAIVIQPADYSSTKELLELRGEAAAKRLWDGTNKLTKPGEPADEQTDEQADKACSGTAQVLSHIV